MDFRISKRVFYLVSLLCMIGWSILTYMTLWSGGPGASNNADFMRDETGGHGDNLEPFYDAVAIGHWQGKATEFEVQSEEDEKEMGMAGEVVKQADQMVQEKSDEGDYGDGNDGGEDNVDTSDKEKANGKVKHGPHGDNKVGAKARVPILNDENDIVANVDDKGEDDAGKDNEYNEYDGAAKYRNEAENIDETARRIDDDDGDLGEGESDNNGPEDDIDDKEGDNEIHGHEYNEEGNDEKDNNADNENNAHKKGDNDGNHDNTHNKQNNGHDMNNKNEIGHAGNIVFRKNEPRMNVHDINDRVRVFEMEKVRLDNVDNEH